MRAPTQPRVRASQRRPEPEETPPPRRRRPARTAAKQPTDAAASPRGSSVGAASATRTRTPQPKPTAASGTTSGAKTTAGARATVGAPRVSELATPVRDRPRVSAQFSERLAERRAAVRRLRWRTIGLVAAAVLLVAAASYVLLLSPLLALRSAEIEVHGTNEIVAEDEVRAIVAEADGTPLARLDTVGLVEELSGIVGVQDAHVQRDWPHGLQVTIVPRVPVATVADGEEYVVLDGEGVELLRSAEVPEHLPLVDVPLGQESTATSLTAVLEVLGALPADLLADVATASAPSPNQVQLELTDGDEVFWGSSAENPLKVRVLQTLRQVQATGYDVSAPRAPITIGEPETE